MRHITFTLTIGLLTLIITLGCDTPPANSGAPALGALPDTDWRAAEQGILADHVQLTFAEKFVKAGEAYFSPDDSRIIFQAIEKPAPGEAADEFYAMFVAEVKHEAATSNITGLTNIKRISPKGSANTCGWFHPTEPNIVIFSSTLTPPSESTPPGYQRASGRYKWMFPPEMRIVRCDLTKADGTAATLETIVGDGKAYHAEGSLSADGRHLLYCSLESNDGDLFVYDMKTRAKNRIVPAKGYDGGPFFSPDGKRICYRSDRRGDNHLQIFVADLAFNEQGEVVGIQREYQLTDNEHVNWCPFWTPDGRHLVYSTSELGHTNYEVFIIDADPGNMAGSTGTTKYGTRHRSITGADRADVLPAFSAAGKWMMWTSQRGKDGESQLWAARWILNPDARASQRQDTATEKLAAGAAQPPAAQEGARSNRGEGNPNRIVIEDPETGRIFIYDSVVHTISEYDMGSHTLTEITDPALIKRVMDVYESQHAPN